MKQNRNQNRDISGAVPRVSNASQSPVPVGRSPIERHFHNPTPNVSTLHKKYKTFCRGSVVIDLGLEAVEGANCAKASLIPAIFLNGERRSMNTIPMLNICTPLPDMYNMKACMGRDLAGPTANSQARLALISLKDWGDATVSGLELPLEEAVDLAKPGGGGRFFHLEEPSRVE